MKILAGLLKENSDIISAEELQKIQSNGKASSDIVFGIKKSDTFKLVNVPINSINAPKFLSLKFYEKKNLDEDINIVRRIIKAIKNNEEITPFVIDSNNKIMYGLHRFVAFKFLFGKDYSVKVYKQQNNLNESNEHLKLIKTNRFVYHK